MSSSPVVPRVRYGSRMEVPSVTESPIVSNGRRGRLGAALGVASLLFLVASLRWAHHWGPLAYTIVFAWAATWIGGFGVSVWALKRKEQPRGFARAGVLIAALMLMLLVGGGIAFAAGADPVAACGGG